MNIKHAVIIVAAIFLMPLPVVAINQYIETRCCVDQIKRDADGDISRSWKARNEFRRRWPCPTGAGLYEPCPGWHIDHIIPLSCSGLDSVSNMQWLPVEIKACAGELCKDRWERDVYCAGE